MEAAPTTFDEPRFVLIEDIDEEAHAESPQPVHGESATPTRKASPPAVSPAEPTGSSRPPVGSSRPPVSQTQPKKKAAASTAKKPRKKGPKGGQGRAKKTAKSEQATKREAEGSVDEGSDNSPYCICRGPDDHRWMIGCESCEDWFHGECVNINKEIGENQIEKFVCQNCTQGDLVTIYKKTCALKPCRKPARLTQTHPSIFCSSEHAQTWWERLLGRLPKVSPKHGISDQLSQENFMALLSSDLGGFDGDDVWKLSKPPFFDTGPPSPSADPLSSILSEEETVSLDKARQARSQLAQETLLCHKMLDLVELAQERRRATIAAGRWTEDICGYNSRLDTISARDAFAAFVRSADGEKAFGGHDSGDSASEYAATEVAGACERRRCKVHLGWQKMLPLGIKYQIKEMASRTGELEQEERIMRQAARERWKRKQVESNWVEVLE